MPRTESAAVMLLQSINRHHQTSLRLLGRFPGGENHGAYAVGDSTGRQLVLKWQAATPASQKRLARAGCVTEQLHLLGYPVPRHLISGIAPSGDVYYVEETLPGTPVGRLVEPSQVERIIALNDFQAGRAVSSEQDWSSYALQVVFDDASGWAAELRPYSSETSSVVAALEVVTTEKRNCGRTHADIVHEDLAPQSRLPDGRRRKHRNCRTPPLPTASERVAAQAADG
jgi:hypothetical protein